MNGITEESDEELWRRMRAQMQLDARNIYPQLHPAIEVPRELLDGPSWWRKYSPELLVLAGVIVFLSILGATLYQGIDRRDTQRHQARMEQHLTPTLDLCAVKLPLTQGRLLKTQGEVTGWRETKDGGIDLYLVKEIDGALSCGMKAHLPPTIPETTWRPTAGERVTLCGLMAPAGYQARMVAAWRCM